MLWGNDIYVEDNASISIIPDAIVTDRQLIYKKQCRLAFYNYAQMHKDDGNTISKERTIGAISLQPVDNYQGTHGFMKLNTGKVTICTNWTMIPMTIHIDGRVHAITYH